MKFTNGYWLLKEEIAPIYAVEYVGHEIEGDTITVEASGGDWKCQLLADENAHITYHGSRAEIHLN